MDPAFVLALTGLILLGMIASWVGCFIAGLGVAGYFKPDCYHHARVEELLKDALAERCSYCPLRMDETAIPMETPDSTIEMTETTHDAIAM